MGFIEISKDCIETEHICCALGAKQYEEAVREKKKWLTERMDEGLVFYRLDERAKVFIEYLPAENAWAPIDAPNYMYINCLWVSGRHKNNGYGKQLLDYCKKDAMNRGMDGIVHIVGKKNYPFLSEKHFFEHHGFKIVDKADPYFQLVALTWNPEAPSPIFKERKHKLLDHKGITIYYTAQCPFAVGTLDELRKIANERRISFQTNRITTMADAQNSPTIWTSFGLFYNGKFITHEMMSPAKFDKLLSKLLQK